MKTIGNLLLICFFLISPINSQAETENSPLVKLDTIADQALEMTKAGRYSDAQKLLQYFHAEFIPLQSNGVILSTNEWAVITATHQQALQVLSEPEGKYQEVLEAMTAFRLAVDAVSSLDKPLWINMEDAVMASLAELQLKAAKPDSAAFHEALNVFLANYNMIQPSLKVDVGPKRFSALDRKVYNLDHFREKLLSDSASAGELEQLEEELQQLFNEKNEESTEPSLAWVISITGGIILSTLSYVSWRKYKGSQDDAKRKLND